MGRPRRSIPACVLGLSLGACSPGKGATSEPAQPDLVHVALPGWTATPGRTPFERFVDYHDVVGACTVRVTHRLPARAGDPPVQGSPVTVLGRRQVSIDGQPFALLRTTDPGDPQSVSIARGGRSATLQFTRCEDAAIDRVLAQTHLAP